MCRSRASSRREALPVRRRSPRPRRRESCGGGGGNAHQNDGRPAGNPRLLDARDEMGRDELAAVREEGVERVICSGVTSRSFWPIASWIESPGFQSRSICQVSDSAPSCRSVASSDRSAAGRCPRRRRRPRWPAEAERPHPALERLAAPRGQVVEAVADLVEVGVAGGGERSRQCHRLVHERVPVVEALPVVPVDGVRRALDRLVRREEVLLHRRERRHRFPRRAGW